MHGEDTHHPVFIRNDLHRIGVIAEHDALFHGFIDLSRYSRHLHSGATVDHTHIRPQSFCHPGAVHGRVAAADNYHVFANIHILAAVDLSQKLHPGEDIP